MVVYFPAHEYRSNPVVESIADKHRTEECPITACRQKPEPYTHFLCKFHALGVKADFVFFPCENFHGLNFAETLLRKSPGIFIALLGFSVHFQTHHHE